MHCKNINKQGSKKAIRGHHVCTWQPIRASYPLICPHSSCYLLHFNLYKKLYMAEKFTVFVRLYWNCKKVLVCFRVFSYCKTDVLVGWLMIRTQDIRFGGQVCMNFNCAVIHTPAIHTPLQPFFLGHLFGLHSVWDTVHPTLPISHPTSHLFVSPCLLTGIPQRGWPWQKHRLVVGCKEEKGLMLTWLYCLKSIKVLMPYLAVLS